MDKDILLAVLSGVFSLTSTLGAIFLQHYLGKNQNNKRSNTAETASAPEKNATGTATPTLKGSSYYLFRPVLLLFTFMLLGVILLKYKEFVWSFGLKWELISASIILLTCTLFFIQRRKQVTAYKELLFQLDVLIVCFGFIVGNSLLQGHFHDDDRKLFYLLWPVIAITGGFFLRIGAMLKKKTGNAQ